MLFQILVSRPLIHGFDLNCVAITPNSSESVKPSLLYLAGDEKVIRVLNCPNGVLNGVKKLTEIDILDPLVPSNLSNVERVDRAYIPELGLSNKAANLMNKQEQVQT
jgi:hypothetical protein